jgi:hypothetical protein
MQLKHLPFLFLIMAAICLTGAVTAAANSADAEPTQVAARR